MPIDKKLVHDVLNSAFRSDRIETNVNDLAFHVVLVDSKEKQDLLATIGVTPTEVGETYAIKYTHDDSLGIEGYYVEHFKVAHPIRDLNNLKSEIVRVALALQPTADFSKTFDLSHPSDVMHHPV